MGAVHGRLGCERAAWARAVLERWPASLPLLMAMSLYAPPWEVPLVGLDVTEVTAIRDLIRLAERGGLLVSAGWGEDLLRVWPVRAADRTWFRGHWVCDGVWSLLGGQTPGVMICLQREGPADVCLGLLAAETAVV